MTTATAESENARAVVERLIRDVWHTDIAVLDAGVGQYQGHTNVAWADLGCKTRLACYHAMLSVADHACNPIDDWEFGWQERDDWPYVLRVWDPVVNLRAAVA